MRAATASAPPPPPPPLTPRVPYRGLHAARRHGRDGVVAQGARAQPLVHAAVHLGARGRGAGRERDGPLHDKGRAPAVVLCRSGRSSTPRCALSPSRPFRSHPLWAAQTYLLESEFPTHDLLGIFNGHLYLMARQRRLLRPPGVLVRWFESQPSLMRRCGATTRSLAAACSPPSCVAGRRSACALASHRSLTHAPPLPGTRRWATNPLSSLAMSSDPLSRIPATGAHIEML